MPALENDHVILVDASDRPTGTMGNTIGVKVHTRHGQEVICESRSHVLNYEIGRAHV